MQYRILSLHVLSYKSFLQYLPRSNSPNLQLMTRAFSDLQKLKVLPHLYWSLHHQWPQSVTLWTVILSLQSRGDSMQYYLNWVLTWALPYSTTNQDWDTLKSKFKDSQTRRPSHRILFDEYCRKMPITLLKQADAIQIRSSDKLLYLQCSTASPADSQP